jgi:archaetidylinositol phosphate synthase
MDDMPRPSDFVALGRPGSERRAVSEHSLFRRSRKDTPTREYVCDWIFRPLAHVLVLALLPLRISPLTVLAAATAAGLGAAIVLGHGDLLLAALLLQAKTVLDNADGQLARASQRVTVVGRYLDSEADLLVNAALFAALGYVTGRYLLALAAFLALTLVLSVDFNLEVLYRRERGELVEPMPQAAGVARFLARVYAVAYAPHDRWLERLVESRLERLGANASARLAYHDRWTLSVVAQLGLSTQLAALGLCLVLGTPSWYLWLVLACGAALLPLAVRRERLARTSPSFPDLAIDERSSA